MKQVSHVVVALVTVSGLAAAGSLSACGSGRSEGNAGGMSGSRVAVTSSRTVGY